MHKPNVTRRHSWYLVMTFSKRAKKTLFAQFDGVSVPFLANKLAEHSADVFWSVIQTLSSRHRPGGFGRTRMRRPRKYPETSSDPTYPARPLSGSNTQSHPPKLRTLFMTSNDWDGRCGTVEWLSARRSGSRHIPSASERRKSGAWTAPHTAQKSLLTR